MTDRPDDETLLAWFGQWLREARAEADAVDPELGRSLALDTEAPEIGVERLVEEFTALRHEVKLQTKSSRGLQDQAEALLPPLRQAMDQFRAVKSREEQAADASGRPLAEALADLDEALERGRIEIERAQRRLAEDADRAAAALERLFHNKGWLIRYFARGYFEQAQALVRDEALDPSRVIFGALLEGYALIQSRLRRGLKAERIERIDCVGLPADPERMTVIELVNAPGHSPGEVVEEVRRGYTWQGRVLRYAEVRAASRFDRADEADLQSATAGTQSESNGTVRSENPEE